MPTIKRTILGVVFAATAGFSFGAGQIHASLKHSDIYSNKETYVGSVRNYVRSRNNHSGTKEMSALSGTHAYAVTPKNYVQPVKHLPSLQNFPQFNFSDGPVNSFDRGTTIDDILARLEEATSPQELLEPPVSPKTTGSVGNTPALLKQRLLNPVPAIPTPSPRKSFAVEKLRASLRQNNEPSLVKKRRVSPGNYNLFRSVVIPVGKLAAFGQWSKVAPVAHVTNACAGSLCKSSTGRRLAAAAERADKLAPVAALRLINKVVNSTIKYRSDRGDHWASLAESAARGYGDCEDYAIAKMQLLNRIGFTPEQLQFVVLRDTRRNLYHAVLAVHVGGRNYVLDNLSNTIASDKIFHSYLPIASFAGAKSFIHGFTGKKSSVAALGKGGFSAVRLGGKS